MKNGECPKCGSQAVIPDVTIVDRGHGNMAENLKVSVPKNPTAWVFKGEVRAALKAWVCGACGFTELYVETPTDLLQAHVAALRSVAERSVPPADEP